MQGEGEEEQVRTIPTRRHRRRTDERGAVAVEFVVMVPALVLIIGFVIAGGRLAHAQQTVQLMADSGARAASLARTAAAAEEDVDLVVHSDADDADLNCSSGLTSSVDTSGFAAPLGQPAEVSVDVACEVTLGDLLVPGLPGTWSVNASARSPLDRFRSRR